MFCLSINIMKEFIPNKIKKNSIIVLPSIRVTASTLTNTYVKNVAPPIFNIYHLFTYVLIGIHLVINSYIYLQLL